MALGIDAIAHVLPQELLYAFLPLALVFPTLFRGREHGHDLILITPNWPAMHRLAEIKQLLRMQPWQLPPQVIVTMQSAQASSTPSFYECKWRVFEEWCFCDGHIPFLCSVGGDLSFLQDVIVESKKWKAFCTIKV